METGRGGGALVVMIKLRGKVRGVDENITWAVGAGRLVVLMC